MSGYTYMETYILTYAIKIYLYSKLKSSDSTVCSGACNYQRICRNDISDKLKAIPFIMIFIDQAPSLNSQHDLGLFCIYNSAKSQPMRGDITYVMSSPMPMVWHSCWIKWEPSPRPNQWSHMERLPSKWGNWQSLWSRQSGSYWTEARWLRSHKTTPVLVVIVSGKNPILKRILIIWLCVKISKAVNF